MTTTRRTSLPLVGDLFAFRADRLGFLMALAAEQGDVATFRIGPYRVWALAHPDYVRDVLITNADRFRKSPVLQRARLVLGEGLLTAEGMTHQRHRRIMQPAFHPRRIDGYAPQMVGCSEDRTARWLPGVPVDVHDETVRITLACAGAALFGTEVQEDVDTVESAVADLLSAYAWAFVPFGWWLHRLPVGPMRRLARGRDALHALVDQIVHERRETGHDRGDLLSMLVLGEHEESRLSDQEIRHELVTLLLAGHETTANALAFALHLLAHEPEVAARLEAEVDAVVGDRLPMASDTERLPLCRGVIAEALRMFPPSWAMARQALVEHQLEGGAVIAPDDLVVLPQWVVHRDPRWWPDPLRCDPDRWIGEDVAGRPRWAFFPFGAGVRRCIGESFAWTEATLAVAVIVRRWRLHPIAKLPLQLDPLITLRPREGLWLRPELRTPDH